MLRISLKYSITLQYVLVIRRAQCKTNNSACNRDSSYTDERLVKNMTKIQKYTKNSQNWAVLVRI